MRIVPGPPQGFSNETTTSNHLMRYAINQPEILSGMAELYKNDVSPLTALLSMKGKTFTKSIFGQEAMSRGYTSVGSREVRWNVKGINNRVINMVRDAVCDAYPTEPGKNQTEIMIYTDTNWASPRDVLELADNQTLVYIHSNKLPREVEAGVWEYKVKLVTGQKSDYVNPELLTVGKDASVLYNMYEEASETAYEKHTFHEQARTWMTIMRLKHSITGTAEAMKANTPIWVAHNGAYAWMSHQEKEMMQRWFAYREHQIILGKRTVNDDGETIMTLEDSQIRVTAGDGLLNQGDGVWKMPYDPNAISVHTYETVMNNMSIAVNSTTGMMEVAVLCGKAWKNNFTRIMKDIAGTDPKVVVVNGSGEKGIDFDYEWFKWSGVKIYPIHWPFLDNFERAGRAYVDQYGNRLESHRAIWVSLGDNGLNNPQIDLLALGDRQMKRGRVDGINKGGQMANSVDAGHEHILSETGIANRDINGVAEQYVPRLDRSSFSVPRV